MNEKRTLWKRIQKGMEEGFEAALSAVHSITEKAGEGIEVTRLRREKARMETEVTRQLAKLGNAVYEKISAERLDGISEKLGIKDILVDVAESEARILDIDRRLGKELENQKK
jgi:flagellar biosynthesis/type III secretory pathway protein FliH